MGLGLPIRTPQSPFQDLLGWDEAPFKPPIPLMPHYVRDIQSWALDAPKFNSGVISIKYLAEKLNWSTTERLSGTLLPNQQAVILRPYDIILRDGTNRHAGSVDDFEIELMTRYRLRLPPSVASTLNLVAENERLIAFARQLPFVKNRRGEKTTSPISVLYLFNPLKFIPDGLEKEIQW